MATKGSFTLAPAETDVATCAARAEALIELTGVKKV